MSSMVMRLAGEGLLPARWRLAGVGLQLKLLRLRLALKAGFDPNQPRVPAGEPDAGRWTDGGGGSFRVAQRAPREGGGRRRIEGEYENATPAQQTRLEMSRVQADAAVARVTRADPTWRARPGLYESVEGEIAHNEDVLREANERYADLLRSKIGFGPHFVRAAPGRGPYTRPTKAERLEVNEIGEEFGCHTCGARNPGSRSGSWFCDHQGPSALGGLNAGRWLVPQCSYCSNGQGWLVRQLREIEGADSESDR